MPPHGGDSQKLELLKISGARWGAAMLQGMGDDTRHIDVRRRPKRHTTGQLPCRQYDSMRGHQHARDQPTGVAARHPLMVRRPVRGVAVAYICDAATGRDKGAEIWIGLAGGVNAMCKADCGQCHAEGKDQKQS